MKISVASCISELLYERDVVVLPGFGGFVADYREASIDQVQGVIHPPSKSLALNSELVYNDQVLADYLSGKYGIGKEEAQKHIQEYVDTIQDSLSKKEIITIPEVGRLYYDFEKKLRFLPDNTNFNKNSFGLPSVNFYPILRNKEEAITHAVKENQPPRPVYVHAARAKSRNFSNSTINKALPWIVAAAVVLMSIGFYFFWDAYTHAPLIDAERLSEIEDRLNKRPSAGDIPAQDSIALQDTAAQITPAEGDSESPTPAPGLKRGIVIVGGFSNKDNAQQLISDIFEEGYEAYSDDRGTLTRVGIQFGYSARAEVDKMLREAKNKFNKSAWVLEPGDYYPD